MEWKATPSHRIEKASYLGDIEVNEELFSVLSLPSRLIFGGVCNVGFLESGYIRKESFETTDETLQELVAELETFYSEGHEYCSRIVCNERM